LLSRPHVKIIINAEIWEVELLENFKVTKLRQYNGTTNAQEHPHTYLRDLSATISLKKVCSVDTSLLPIKGKHMLSLISYASGSNRSWDDLFINFISHFVVSERTLKSATKLMKLAHKDKEL